jgi:hypothetical protein
MAQCCIAIIGPMLYCQHWPSIMVYFFKYAFSFNILWSETLLKCFRIFMACPLVDHDWRWYDQRPIF